MKWSSQMGEQNIEMIQEPFWGCKMLFTVYLLKAACAEHHLLSEMVIE